MRLDMRDDNGAFGLAFAFCPRYYLLTLAELVEVHVPTCNGSLTDHLGASDDSGSDQNSRR